MVWLPVKMAVSAMVMEEEKLTGAFGPNCTLGRIDRRWLEDMVDGCEVEEVGASQKGPGYDLWRWSDVADSVPISEKVRRFPKSKPH